MIKGVFETLETADVDMSTAHSMIEPIVNLHFGNTFHHHNVPNQRQHIHLKTIQKYQSRPYQRPRTSPIPYLKVGCLGCGINNKGVRELSMQHYGKLDTCLFRG